MDLVKMSITYLAEHGPGALAIAVLVALGFWRQNKKTSEAQAEATKAAEAAKTAADRAETAHKRISEKVGDIQTIDHDQDIAIEGIRGDIKVLTQGQAILTQKLDDGIKETRGQLTAIMRSLARINGERG